MPNRGRVVIQGGRAKAYRPMPPAARRAAFEQGLAAYANGDFFLAHELLEPPWMGARDIAERELIQGVIKLAAAFVHGARSNPTGIEKNLRGARERLAGASGAGAASAGAASAGAKLGVDVPALLLAIDERLSRPPRVGDPPIEIVRLAAQT